MIMICYRIDACKISFVIAPLRLDVRHYETVVAIVEFGSMTEAARQLSISQSAMSHRLAEAERRLGVTLFTRGSDRRLSPTNNGVALSQAAARALADLGRVEETLVGTDSSVQVTVRIGVGGYEAFHWYPSFLRAARRDNPAIELDLLAVGDDPGTSLADRTVDLVLAPGQPSGDHVLVPVLDDALVFTCAPHHRLADRATVEAVDLVDETYLTYNALPSPGFEYDRFIRPAGGPPRIVRVVRQTSAIIEMVAAGVGVSILSKWATMPLVESGRIATAQCGADGLPITWRACHRRSDQTAAMVADLLATHLGADLFP